MRKIIVLLAFFFAVIFFQSIAYSQESPTPIPTKDPTTTDLGAPYNLECVTAATKPPAGSGPPAGIVSATFTGTCSSNQPCHVVACKGKTDCTTYDKALDVFCIDKIV